MQCKDYWKPILINVIIVNLLISLCVVHQHRRLYFTGWTESGTTDPPLRKLPVLLKDSPQHTRRMFDLCMRVSEFSRTPLFWLPWCLRPWGGPRLGSICHNEFWRETNWIQGCTITHKCAACHKSLMVRILDVGLLPQFWMTRVVLWEVSSLEFVWRRAVVIFKRRVFVWRPDSTSTGWCNSPSRAGFMLFCTMTVWGLMFSQTASQSREKSCIIWQNLTTV